MKFLICLLLILPSIFSFLTKSKIPIQIMSFNLRYDNPDDGWEAWGNRRDFVAALIKKYDPDLLGQKLRKSRMKMKNIISLHLLK